MSGEPEQTVHSIEEVGFLHHAWDEVGPQLTTGVCLIIVAILGYLGIRHKSKNKRKSK